MVLKYNLPTFKQHTFYSIICFEDKHAGGSGCVYARGLQWHLQ